MNTNRVRLAALAIVSAALIAPAGASAQEDYWAYEKGILNPSGATKPDAEGEEYVKGILNPSRTTKPDAEGQDYVKGNLLPTEGTKYAMQGQQVYSGHEKDNVTATPKEAPAAYEKPRSGPSPEEMIIASLEKYRAQLEVRIRDAQAKLMKRSAQRAPIHELKALNVQINNLHAELGRVKVELRDAKKAAAKRP